MAKDNLGVIIVIVVVIGAFFFFGDNEQIQSILPELDNRITYIDKKEDMTEFVKTFDDPDTLGGDTYENNKFICKTAFARNFGISEDRFTLSSAGCVSSPIICTTKKDFTRLNTFVTLSEFGDSSRMDLNGNEFNPSAEQRVDNYEIMPDNLNKGIYNIFKNGEFDQRIDIGDIDLDLTFKTGGGTCQQSNALFIDKIKFVPIEAFIIRNDEVWVKEVRGSDYSFDILAWEMIGFSSQIRPATIRDLTAETEVPAPQIYINLINDRTVQVQSNTVHTFFYKTKWVQGLDSSCQGNLDQVQVKGSDGIWRCESFVTETPIIQQCQVKEDCPILPECESQRDLIVCNQDTNRCVYDDFSIACKNQLITFQEKVTEIEKTKFVPIPSGANSFFCFFDEDSTSCKVGEKTISMAPPLYTCVLPSEAGFTTIQDNDPCWKSTLSFSGDSFSFKNNEIKDIYTLPDGENTIKAEVLLSATLQVNEVFDEETGTFNITGSELRDWSSVAKVTLPDNFLDIKGKELGNKFVLQNSNEPVTFTIVNNLGFGIDGGYTLQSQNLALEGGVVLRDDTKELFLKDGDNDVTYRFLTSQLGTIVDVIGNFGKVTTDREYIMKSSSDGKQKFLLITKEIRIVLPPSEELEKVNQVIVSEDAVEDIISVAEEEKEGIPVIIKVLGAIIGAFLLLRFI